jgi:hypothetical protein
VMIPPAATARTTAAEVQPAGLPFPITWSGCAVSTARPAAGTGKRADAMPASGTTAATAVATTAALASVTALRDAPPRARSRPIPRMAPDASALRRAHWATANHGQYIRATWLPVPDCVRILPPTVGSRTTWLPSPGTPAPVVSPPLSPPLSAAALPAPGWPGVITTSSRLGMLAGSHVIVGAVPPGQTSCGGVLVCAAICARTPIAASFLLAPAIPDRCLSLTETVPSAWRVTAKAGGLVDAPNSNAVAVAAAYRRVLEHDDLPHCFAAGEAVKALVDLVEGEAM